MKKGSEQFSAKASNVNPIINLVEDWQFVIDEVSNGVYQIKGVDLWGHSVSRTCTELELETTLMLCATDAKEIKAQLEKKKL